MTDKAVFAVLFEAKIKNNPRIRSCVSFVEGKAKFDIQRARRRLRLMTTRSTALIKKDGDWWIGWIEEIPGANAQERSREELILSLKQAARDMLELHRQAAIGLAEENFEEIPLAL